MTQTLIQKILSNHGCDSHYIDEQNLISKFSLLELLQKYERYACLDSSFDTRYYDRIATSLQFIPPPFQKTALTLFANVFYVGESVLNDSLVYLLKEILAGSEGEDDEEVVRSMHLFELDPSGLIESFFRINKISGRLDSDTYSRCKSVGEFITTLHHYCCCPSLQEDAFVLKSIQAILAKKTWVLLTDFSFSGTSLSSELERLLQLRDLCGCRDSVRIVICVQLISEIVLSRIEQIQETYKAKIVILYSQLYGDELRVIPKGTLEKEGRGKTRRSLLFEGNKTVYNNVVKLCQWFGAEYIDKDPRQAQTRKQGEEATLAFGYKNCGYTVIPQRNAPSNALPILWYCPSKEYIQEFKKTYIPPFPRTVSRMTQSTSGDRQHLEEIIRKKDQVSTLLHNLKQTADENCRSGNT